MAGGGGWLGSEREKKKGFYRPESMPRRLLHIFVAYKS
jgi:hypothetical protein